MKDRHLSLNQTQRVRLEAALQELQSVAPAAASAAAVTVADTIPVNQEDNILKYRASLTHTLSLSLFLSSPSCPSVSSRWVGARGAGGMGRRIRTGRWLRRSAGWWSGSTSWSTSALFARGTRAALLCYSPMAYLFLCKLWRNSVLDFYQSGKYTELCCELVMLNLVFG
jgi:hypothetical protein